VQCGWRCVSHIENRDLSTVDGAGKVQSGARFERKSDHGYVLAFDPVADL
jgi:hypothetical protein